jgi:hypothetical protein
MTKENYGMIYGSQSSSEATGTTNTTQFIHRLYNNNASG